MHNSPRLLQYYSVSRTTVRPELVEGESKFFKISKLDFTCSWFDKLTTNGDRLCPTYGLHLDVAALKTH